MSKFILRFFESFQLLLYILLYSIQFMHIDIHSKEKENA